MTRAIKFSPEGILEFRKNALRFQRDWPVFKEYLIKNLPSLPIDLQKQIEEFGIANTQDLIEDWRSTYHQEDNPNDSKAIERFLDGLPEIEFLRMEGTPSKIITHEFFIDSELYELIVAISEPLEDSNFDDNVKVAGTRLLVIKETQDGAYPIGDMNANLALFINPDAVSDSSFHSVMDAQDEFLAEMSHLMISKAAALMENEEPGWNLQLNYLDVFEDSLLQCFLIPYEVAFNPECRGRQLGSQILAEIVDAFLENEYRVVSIPIQVMADPVPDTVELWLEGSSPIIEFDKEWQLNNEKILASLMSKVDLVEPFNVGTFSFADELAALAHHSLRGNLGKAVADKTFEEIKAAARHAMRNKIHLNNNGDSRDDIEEALSLDLMKMAAKYLQNGANHSTIAQHLMAFAQVLLEQADDR